MVYFSFQSDYAHKNSFSFLLFDKRRQKMLFIKWENEKSSFLFVLATNSNNNVSTTSSSVDSPTRKSSTPNLAQ